MEQRWFPGAHSNVGGGYDDDLLPDPPLAWVASKAVQRSLHFVNDRGAVDAGSGVRPPSLAKVPADRFARAINFVEALDRSRPTIRAPRLHPLKASVIVLIVIGAAVVIALVLRW